MKMLLETFYEDRSNGLCIKTHERIRVHCDVYEFHFNAFQHVQTALNIMKKNMRFSEAQKHVSYKTWHNF